MKFDNKFNIVLLTSVIVFLLSTPLSGCSCRGPKFYLPKVKLFTLYKDLKPEVNDTELVFEGILIKKELDSAYQNRDYILTYEVTDVYVGKCVDTIVVKTPRYSASCGYQDEIGFYSIISTKKNKQNTYFISRSDCSLNVSEKYQPMKYKSFRNLLVVTKYRINGSYSFRANQFRSNGCKYPELVLNFEIKNKKLDGNFTVQDSNGHYLESGSYTKGLKNGQWKYRLSQVYKDSDSGYVLTDSLLINRYLKGRLLKTDSEVHVYKCS